MITYVNTVIVGGTNEAIINSIVGADGKDSLSYNASNIGKIIVTNKAGNAAPSAEDPTVRIGQITNKAYTDKTGKHHVIKWANTFNAAEDIKSMTYTAYEAETEESVEIDFTNGNATIFSTAGNRIVVRLTFKDLPTRFRKWSESYEVTTTSTINSAATVAKAFADTINEQYKRARIVASATGGKLTLTAMPYDDDDVVDSISWANKVRFQANMWYTKPYAAGFDSKNKYSVDGAVITKTPGKQGVGTAKLVRDREAQAMGYMGVLNRGECTWPIIKPDMFVTLDGTYNTLTIEFERMYRTADDLQRKTKEAIEIYCKTAANAETIKSLINTAAGATATTAAVKD